MKIPAPGQDCARRGSAVGRVSPDSYQPIGRRDTNGVIRSVPVGAAQVTALDSTRWMSGWW